MNKKAVPRQFPKLAGTVFLTIFIPLFSRVYSPMPPGS